MAQRIMDEAEGYRPWKSQEVFADIRFKTAGECIDKLADSFLSTPLNDEQRAVLIKSLGERMHEKTEITVADLNRQNMDATLRLLLSTAEYQLC